MMEPIPYENWTAKTGKDRRKCAIHNFWMKKGRCEICTLEAEAKQKDFEKLHGSNKPPIKYGKI